MKQLVCEMCGSSDLVKQDGVFICQHCGAKYSVEEAKKMMVEGTVKIDSSEELDNLYTLARRARDTGNSKDAAKYYEMVLLKIPNDWEASFYTIYYTTAQTVIANIMPSARTFNNALPAIFGMMYEQLDEPNRYNNISTVITKSIELEQLLDHGLGGKWSIARGYEIRTIHLTLGNEAEAIYQKTRDNRYLNLALTC